MFVGMEPPSPGHVEEGADLVPAKLRTVSVNRLDRVRCDVDEPSNPARWLWATIGLVVYMFGGDGLYAWRVFST